MVFIGFCQFLLRLRFYVLPSLSRFHEGAGRGALRGTLPLAALIRSPFREGQTEYETSGDRPQKHMSTNQDQNSQSTTSGLPSRTERVPSDTNPQGQSPSPIPAALESPIVFTYSRKDALADGFQMDVSAMAKEAGFTVPVFMTIGVFSTHVEVPEGVSGQDENGRLWDILNVVRWSIKKMTSDSRFVEFQVLVRNSDVREPETVKLIAEIGAMDFDDPRPAITIAFPNED